MTLTVTPSSSLFGARITGVDLVNGLDEDTFATVRAAFDEHSVLVFPGQPMDDDQQIAFSERFGHLEGTAGVNPGTGTPFARQSNIDIETGATIPPDDRRMGYQKSNYLWHSDSTFKAVPSLCSVLTAREVPPEGGATEFASTRIAYEGLPDDTKARLESLVVEHDFSYSRGLTGFAFSAQEAAEYPPVRHDLVRTNAGNGRRSLLIGAHAKAVVGWPADESRELLDDLLAQATQSGTRLTHEWRTGDAVVWDNQAVLHRATEYDTNRHRRLMQRTTISAGQPVRPSIGVS
jgi:alpha-ketoglutarate-dependent 2,4-dichlorophenoxyacetate dioxygenase